MENLEDYILEHSDREPALLAEINREVNIRLLYPRMCSGHLQGRILTMLTSMIAPRRALEIGAYAGYSALCIAEGLPAEGHLDTIEIDDEMEAFILSNFARSPFGEKITLHIGDVARVLPKLEDGAYPLFDMVYMDANKRTYWETFELILPMVRPGGFILADNTLWDGKVLDPEGHRDAQTRGICEFNDRIASDTRISRVMLPLRDGLTLIRVNERK